MQLGQVKISSSVFLLAQDHKISISLVWLYFCGSDIIFMEARRITFAWFLISFLLLSGVQTTCKYWNDFFLSPAACDNNNTLHVILYSRPTTFETWPGDNVFQTKTMAILKKHLKKLWMLLLILWESKVSLLKYRSKISRLKKICS